MEKKELEDCIKKLQARIELLEEMVYRMFMHKHDKKGDLILPNIKRRSHDSKNEGCEDSPGGSQGEGQRTD